MYCGTYLHRAIQNYQINHKNLKKMKNKVIKVLTKAHGKVVVAYWKSVGINVCGYYGFLCEEDGDTLIYYGVINGIFEIYTFRQVEESKAEIIEIPHNFLIGKKIRRNGEIGTIEFIDTLLGIGVKFEYEVSFWDNYTEVFDHLVDEETVKDELPTLGVGVLMMVSNDEDINFKQRFVIAKTKCGYLAWAGAETADEIEFKYAKFWEFAKKIEQKVILTKQDISDGKGVGIEPHLIEIV